MSLVFSHVSLIHCPASPAIYEHGPSFVNPYFMEGAHSSSLALHAQLPPGFRFHPTDEELLVHYLKRKLASVPLPVAIIAEVDLYKFDPWELPEKASFGEHEWYFFSPRDRKYPNGARPNRAATSGYWKATGTDKAIATSGGHKVGVKKALVFYSGKPPKGTKTSWIMQEYRLIESGSSSTKKGSLRLDDWVLCRVYQKRSSQKLLERDGESSVERASYGSFAENDCDAFFGGLLNDSGGHMQQSTSCSKEFPSKRQVCSQSFWVKSQDPGDQSSGIKGLDDHRLRQHAENCNSGGVFSHVARHSSSFGASSYVGSIGDGVMSQQYHLPGVNWGAL